MQPKSMFVLRIVVILGICLLASQACEITPSSIICNGYHIKDASLLQLKQILRERYRMAYFLQVLISETQLTAIPEQTFTDITFENILIDGNSMLKKIDLNAFQEQSCRTMAVINNQALQDDSLFALSSKLHVSESLDFDFNGLKAIPTNAFSQTDGRINQVKKLVLTNNQIEHIGNNAFQHLLECKEIYVNMNRINSIASAAFNLTDVYVSHVLVNLEKNHLTSDSFSEDFLIFNTNVQVSLNLAHNKIIELRQEIFEPLLKTNKLVIDLTGNPIKCATWIASNVAYKAQIRGTHCH